MKKTLCLLLAALLIAALFVGCSSGKTPEGTKATENAAVESTAASAPEGPYLTLNGEYITLGLAFADVKDKLGEETAPAEEMYACDPGSDWKQTMHTYAFGTVTEDKDGVLNSIQISSGDATVNGTVGIGATVDKVKAALGEPESEEEGLALYYTFSNVMVNLFLEQNTVTGFNMMLSD